MINKTTVYLYLFLISLYLSKVWLNNLVWFKISEGLISLI